MAPEPPAATVTPARPPEREVAPEPPPGHTLLRLTPPSAQQGQQGVILLLDTAPSSFFTSGGTADFGPGIALRSFEVLSPISARAKVNVAPDAPPGLRALTLRRALLPPATFADVFTVTAARCRATPWSEAHGTGGRDPATSSRGRMHQAESVR